MTADARTYAYGQAALGRCAAALANAKNGTRNACLYRQAAALGSLVAGGYVDEAAAVETLTQGAIACDLVQDDGQDAALKTIRSGLNAGMKTPRKALNEKPQNGASKPAPDFANKTAENLSAKAKKHSRIVKEYVYRTADGENYLKVCRTDPKGAFPQFHWDGARWRSGKPKGPKIPYRLPDILDRQTVFVVEGEKDADKLAALGFASTTASEGAGKWTADLNQWFKDRTVYVIADNDEPGRAHAEMVRKNLDGVAREIFVCRGLPGVGVGGDVSDWLEAGNDADGLEEICLAGGVAPEVANETNNADKGVDGAAAAAEEDYPFAELLGMEFPPPKWIVPNFVPEGLTLFAGKPKIGKSWFVLDMAITVARGGYMLGETQCEQGDVLYAALEDTQADMKERGLMIAPNTDEWPRRLFIRHELPALSEGGLEKIEAWIKRAENPRLIIIDTLVKVSADRSANKTQYQADSALLDGLKKLAGEHRLAIVVVHHTRKMESSDPIDEVSGTLGLTGVADTTLRLTRAPGGQRGTLYGRGRRSKEIEMAVEMDSRTCRWRVLGDAASTKLSKERATIIEVLNVAKGPMSRAEITAATGFKPQSVGTFLFEMHRDGAILKASRGLYVHPDHADAADEANKTNKPDEAVERAKIIDALLAADEPLSGGDVRAASRTVLKAFAIDAVLYALKREGLIISLGKRGPYVHKDKPDLLPKDDTANETNKTNNADKVRKPKAATKADASKKSRKPKAKAGKRKAVASDAANEADQTNKTNKARKPKAAAKAVAADQTNKPVETGADETDGTNKPVETVDLEEWLGAKA